MGLVGVLGGPIRSCRLCISQSGSGKLGGKRKSQSVRRRKKGGRRRYLSRTAKMNEKTMYLVSSIVDLLVAILYKYITSTSQVHHKYVSNHSTQKWCEVKEVYILSTLHLFLYYISSSLHSNS